MYSRNRLTAGLAAVTVAFALGACDDSSPSSPSSPSLPEAELQNNSRQVGLVNVSTGDIELLNNVNLAVAANVIATVCDVTIPIAVLAAQVVAEGDDTFCSTEAGPIRIEQATPAENPAPAGGNNSRQEGLINVSLGDVEILNNVNVAVAANVLVTVCDLTVAAAVLAVQGVGDAGETFCQTTAGPIRIVQEQA
ncbi:MAG TPA: hypothetical protein VD930_09905 [Gemmatimonadales bacterium]|nr:hypothetical protein [Gemmatimonadales bacterium]